MSSHAIIVEIGQPEKSCVIDIPFTPEFVRERRAIHNAASNLGLQPSPFPPGDVFTQRIIRKTRSARLVVAVCTPDSRFGECPPSSAPPASGPSASGLRRAGKPPSGTTAVVCAPASKRGVSNPNVLYEFGLARSLGKPILLMTTDAASVPADFRDVNAYVYQKPQTDEEEKVLSEAVELRMRQLIDLSPNDVTVSAAPDPDEIWVAEARQSMLLTREFWTSFGIVFTFANGVYSEMERVYRDHCKDIERRAEVLVFGGGRGWSAEAQQFVDVWNTYLAQYRARTARVLLAPSRLVTAQETLNGMAQNSGARDQILTIQRFSQLVTGGLTLYQRVHEETERMCSAISTESAFGQPLAEFKSQISHLLGAIRALIDYSGGLVDSLVKMVAGGFEPASLIRFPVQTTPAANQGPGLARTGEKI